jgi:HlyD family secretion protein
VGQTVAASFQAPVLFVIANDLTRMQVNAAVDEADVGRVQPGQDVTFRVDAYPDRSFAGRVEQVRLQPQTIQNVVSYNTIITVDNSEQKLMPGMTATVSVVVRKAENVLRLPAAALRFRPAGFQAEGGRAPRAGRPEGSTATDAGGADRGAGAGAVRAADRSPSSPRRGDRGPEIGDSRATESEVRGSLVFVLGEGERPEPARVQVGLSDGQFVEVRDGLAEGTVIVTGLDTGTGRAAAGARTGPSPSSTANPFAPRPPQRRQR